MNSGIPQEIHNENLMLEKKGECQIIHIHANTKYQPHIFREVYLKLNSKGNQERDRSVNAGQTLP